MIGEKELSWWMFARNQHIHLALSTSPSHWWHWGITQNGVWYPGNLLWRIDIILAFPECQVIMAKFSSLVLRSPHCQTQNLGPWSIFPLGRKMVGDSLLTQATLRLPAAAQGVEALPVSLHTQIRWAMLLIVKVENQTVTWPSGAHFHRAAGEGAPRCSHAPQLL